MPYPETKATVDDITNNPVLKRELFEAFNKKAKEGIERIQKICAEDGVNDPAEQRRKAASFYLNNKENLNLGSIADYISGPEQEHKGLLESFVSEYAPQMKGQEFTQALRGYFENFKSPGEAQKVDRFVNSFARAYLGQNPECGIPGPDAAYILSFQAIMLATDAHRPGVVNKMTLEQCVDNLEYTYKDQKEKVDTSFLKKDEFINKFYKDLTSTPLAPTFQKIDTSYEPAPAQLKNDKTLGKVDKMLGKKEFDPKGSLGLNHAKASVDQRKPLLGFLTGYKSTVTIIDDKNNKVTVEISKPGIFSKKQPSVVIKPVGDSPGSLALAGQVAGSFDAPSDCKASFAYQREDMASHLPEQKQLNKAGLGTKAEMKPTQQSLKNETPKLSRTAQRDLKEAGLGVDTRSGVSQPVPPNIEVKAVVNELKSVLANRKIGDTTGLKKVGENKPGEDLNVSQRRSKGLGNG